MPITVQVNGDFNIEPDEAFTVHLNTPVNATISDADGTGTIVNDDFTPLSHMSTTIGRPLPPAPILTARARRWRSATMLSILIQEGIDAVAASGQVQRLRGHV